MKNIEDILNNIDSNSKELQENGVTNFIGNVANKVFNGQSFAQSNANRAQKALDKQSANDKMSTQAKQQGSQVAGMMDSFPSKDVSTVGKKADDVVKEIDNIKNLNPENISGDQQKTLKTIKDIFGNSTMNKNGVGGTVKGEITAHKDEYDKTYSSKGLSAFLKDVLAGKVKQDTNQQQNSQNVQNNSKDTNSTIDKNIDNIIGSLIKSRIVGDQLKGIGA